MLDSISCESIPIIAKEKNPNTKPATAQAKRLILTISIFSLTKGDSRLSINSKYLLNGPSICSVICRSSFKNNRPWKSRINSSVFS